MACDPPSPGAIQDPQENRNTPIIQGSIRFSEAQCQEPGSKTKCYIEQKMLLVPYHPENFKGSRSSRSGMQGVGGRDQYAFLCGFFCGHKFSRHLIFKKV